MGIWLIAFAAIARLCFGHRQQDIEARQEIGEYITPKVEKYNAACDKLAAGDIHLPILPKPQQVVNGLFYTFGEYIEARPMTFGILIVVFVYVIYLFVR